MEKSTRIAWWEWQGNKNTTFSRLPPIAVLEGLTFPKAVSGFEQFIPVTSPATVSAFSAQ